VTGLSANNETEARRSAVMYLLEVLTCLLLCGSDENHKISSKTSIWILIFPRRKQQHSVLRYDKQLLLAAKLTHW